MKKTIAKPSKHKYLHQADSAVQVKLVSLEEAFVVWCDILNLMPCC